MKDYKIRFQVHDVLYFFLLVFSFYFTRNVICSIMMILFFGYTVLRQMLNREKVAPPFFCVAFLAFILYGAANILFDNVLRADVARKMVISLSLSLMMIYAITQYILMRRDVPKVLYITEISIFAVCIVIILQSIGTISQGRLASGTEMNSNMLAMLCVYGAILAAFLRRTNKISIGFFLASFAVYIIAILLTGSRKGLIMFVLAIMILNLKGGWKRILGGVLIGVMLAVVLYILVMNVKFLYDIIGIRIESLLNLLIEGSTDEGSLNSRQELIEIGMEYIKKKPWTGYGYDCFKVVSGRGEGGYVSAEKFGYYSHNNYIELLFGGGIIGLILYYIPMLSLLKNLLQMLKKNPVVIYLLAIIVVKLVVEYAYVSCFERIDAYIHGIVLGCIIAVANTVNKEKADG